MNILKVFYLPNAPSYTKGTQSEVRARSCNHRHLLDDKVAWKGISGPFNGTLYSILINTTKENYSLEGLGWNQLDPEFLPISHDCNLPVVIKDDAT